MMQKYLFLATDHGLLTFARQKDEWCVMSWGLEDLIVTTVAAHKGVVLAGTTNGIYRTEDLGKSWLGKNEGLTIPHIRKLIYYLENKDVVLAGTEPAGIFISFNNGSSWLECPEVAGLRDKYGWCLPYSQNAGCIRDFAYHGNRVYAAAEQGGVLGSEDGGRSWHLVEGSTGNPTDNPSETYVHPDVHSLSVHPSSADLVLAVTGNGLYGSDNGGKTWIKRYPCYCRAVWSDPKQTSHLILGPADSVDLNGRIEESLDGGRTWKTASAGLETPWPDHMVQQFLYAEDHLMAVLSSGRIITTPLIHYSWRYILTQVASVTAVALMEW